MTSCPVLIRRGRRMLRADGPRPNTVARSSLATSPGTWRNPLRPGNCSPAAPGSRHLAPRSPPIRRRRGAHRLQSMTRVDSGEGGPQVNQMAAVDVETSVHDSTALDSLAPTSTGTAAPGSLDDLAATFEAVVANVRSSYLGRDLTVRL